MTNDTRQPAIATKGEDTPPREWNAFGMTWNEADSKVAIITVGGTVLGGVLLVLIVGLALAVVHWANKHNAAAGTFVSSVNLVSGSILVYAIVRQARFLRRVGWAAMTIFLTITVLAATGYAAGIK